jgi:uncharacterized protein YxeA
MKKAIITVVIAVAVIVGGGFLTNYMRSKPNIPTAYVKARTESTQIAEQINTLINLSLSNLAAIERADRSGNYEAAIKLVSEEVLRRREAQNQVVLLAGDMQKMAESVGSIQPDNARQTALEAATTGATIVSKLIEYNAAFADFLTTLSAKFEGDSEATPKKIQGYVGAVNNEAKNINQLINQFNGLLSDLDRIMGNAATSK